MRYLNNFKYQTRVKPDATDEEKQLVETIDQKQREDLEEQIQFFDLRPHVETSIKTEHGPMIKDKKKYTIVKKAPLALCIHFIAIKD